MNIILLSGGSGKRLWPLSNDVRSKQFIRLFKTPGSGPVSGPYESMVQRVYRQIRTVDPAADVTVATSRSQVSAIHSQLGPDVGISVEPCRRDTFPAIALATAYLHDRKGLSADDAVAVCPVDPYVDVDYFRCVRALYETALRGESNLALIGITPTGPSEKYGYIKPVRRSDGSSGYAFTEKPDREKAREYIAAGALWNGGVFAYRLSYVLDKARELLGTADYETLYKSYAELKKISFDYAVVEQESSIEVLPYTGTWEDLGTWNALAGALEEPVIGRGTLGDGCRNVHIVNELNLPILAMGMQDAVIAASPDGILVSSMEQSSRIKPYADALDGPVMTAEKSWGHYEVIHVQEASMTVLVTMEPGRHMSYHSHDRRREIWTVIRGSGRTVADGCERPVRTGDVVTVEPGTRHTVFAGSSGLQMIEVQIGEEIHASDKHKYELPSGVDPDAGMYGAKSGKVE